jgi:hypothetical protein
VCLSLLVASAASAQGRYKQGGDGSCAWDGNDGGPDQCVPAQAVIELQQIGAETTALCDEGGEQAPYCNAVAQEMATMVTFLAPTPVAVVSGGYELYCAGWNLLVLMNEWVLSYDGPETDWSDAPIGVTVKMLEWMNRNMPLR